MVFSEIMSANSHQAAKAVIPGFFHELMQPLLVTRMQLVL